MTGPAVRKEWRFEMRIIHGTTNIRFDFPTAVTIGKFDGLHRGHQKLIHELKANVKPNQKTVVFTFDVPVTEVLDETSSPVITTKAEKRRLMEAMGVDILIEYPFTEETRRMEAKDFVCDLLVNRLCMKSLTVGPDCGFGYQRRGNVALLENLSRDLNFMLNVVEKERTRKDNLVISSSRIKAELRKGDIEEVNRLLGYLYSVNGHALDESGRYISAHLVKEKGAWTIAQSDGEFKLVLPEGNYFSKVWIGDKCVRSVTTITRISDTEGKLLTKLKEPILAENRADLLEIGLIAQF